MQSQANRFWAGYGRIASLLAGLLTPLAFCSVFAELLPSAVARIQAAYEVSKKEFSASPEDASAAAKFAHMCFETAELSTNSNHRMALAQEGAAAARKAIEQKPDWAGGYLYLGLNLGEQARWKRLSALYLLRDMEKAFLRSLELDPQFDWASAARSLGQLYMGAPGWPVSIGSNRKAREYLKRAAAAAPDYPDNQLTLVEAFVDWNDKDLAAEMEKYRELLPEAKKAFTGPEYEQSWKDWEERWQEVVRTSAARKKEP